MQTFIMDTYTRAHVLEAAAHRDATDIFETKLKETYAQLKVCIMVNSGVKIDWLNVCVYDMQRRKVPQRCRNVIS